MAAYTKTRSGEWVALGLVTEVTKGRTVTVTKRDGSSKQEYVTKVGSTFTAKWGEHKGQKCCYGYLAPTPAPTKTYAPEYCGYPCPVTKRRCNAYNGPCHDCE